MLFQFNSILILIPFILSSFSPKFSKLHSRLNLTFSLTSTENYSKIEISYLESQIICKIILGIGWDFFIISDSFCLCTGHVYLLGSTQGNGYILFGRRFWRGILLITTTNKMKKNFKIIFFENWWFNFKGNQNNYSTLVQRVHKVEFWKWQKNLEVCVA